jgi:acyl-CoA thioesterase-1
MKTTILLCALFGLATGCQRHVMRIHGESLVLAGDRPGRLLGTELRQVTVRSTYLQGGTVYERGRDYEIDARGGTIRRTAASRIPDFSTSVLYGKKDFDHSQFPGYGNTKFFAYVDYEGGHPISLAQPSNQSARLPRTAARLRDGQSVKIVAFGDSITAGGEASSTELQFPMRYAGEMRRRFPKATVAVENGATGGDNTVMGLQRLQEKVLSRKPDLVLIGFGMNDHNLPGVGGVEPEQFKANLRMMIEKIRSSTDAEVILLSCFPPNPDWHFGTHRMAEYASATKAVADEMNTAYADVYSVWQKVLARKDPSSLLANNINHPNDFGHWLYLQALLAIEF